MKLFEKLQLIRKKRGYSQEILAEKLGVARQTISKWESGQAVPELDGLILISELYGVSIDRLVKEDDTCNTNLLNILDFKWDDIIIFLIHAKQNCYAASGNEIASSRIESHDLQYEKGDFLYYDTYLGGESFSGEEAVWSKNIPVWSMNYSGRVTDDKFQGDFLKEVLYNVPFEKPFRGPEVYQKGDYIYHCKVDGEFSWFQGYEEIFYINQKIYECYFHGGIIK